MSGFWPIFFATLVVGQLINERTSAIYFTNNIYSDISNIIVSFLGLSRLLGTPTFCDEWWYLSAMVVFILITPLLLRSIQVHGAIATLFFIVAFPRILGVGFQGGMGILTFIMPLALGIIFEEYHIFDRVRKIGGENANSQTRKVLFGGLLCVSLFISYKLYYFLPTNVFWEIKYGIVPVTFIIFCNECILPISVIRKPLEFLGKHSANIYFVHSIFLYIYLKDLHFTQVWFAFTPIVCLALSLFVSLALEWAKRRLHYNLLISKLSNYFRSDI